MATEAYRFSPTRPELPRQLFHRWGTSQGHATENDAAERRVLARWGGRVRNAAVFSIRYTVSTILPKNLRLSISSCAARAS